MAVKLQPMDRTTLVSIIKSHRQDSLGVEDNQLSTDRASAMNHYHGRPYGNEVDGRSQVVSRDLAEAVDWCIPSLMRLFTQSGCLGEFDPINEQDEQLAQQESDYVNQVLMRDNPGFMVLHDAIKDTLLLKNGYVKHWWEVTDKITETSFSGLSMDEITLMLTQLQQEGAEYEILGQTSKVITVPGPSMQMPQGGAQIEVFDIRLKITREVGKVVWMAVPSEEVRVSKKARGSLQDAPFCEHVTKKTRSDLIEMGMSSDFVYSLASHNERLTMTQELARDSTVDESDTTGEATGDPSMDEIEYCEAFIRVDFDGDGVAELRKVVTVSDQIPPGDQWNEPIAAVPMTSFVAKRVPHRHVGESLDDELNDLQEILTTLKRQLLDNIYRVNNAEMAINEDANLRDFLTSTPGGVKRIKGSNPVSMAFAPITTAPIIDKILPVIDFFEQSKQQRSGINAMTDLDPDVLQNTTKGAFLENLNRASQKMEMIARMLAETGVKEAVLQVHALLIRHQDKARQVQLRGKWVEVNPQNWQERTDLTVRVGLGTGNEQEKQQKLQMLAGLQGQLLQALVAAPGQVYARMYALFEDTAKAMGFETPEKYAVAPNSQEYQELQQQLAQQRAQQQQQGQPGADDLSKAAAIQAQAQVQIAGAKTEADLRVKAAKDQFDRDKAMLDAQAKAQNAEADRRLEAFLENMRLMHQQQQADLDRASREAIAAMQQEVILRIKGAAMDLGAPGISAGVQGAPGVPLQDAEPAGEQQMDGAQAPTGQQTMPPDGMGA